MITNNTTVAAPANAAVKAFSHFAIITPLDTVKSLFRSASAVYPQDAPHIF